MKHAKCKMRPNVFVSLFEHLLMARWQGLSHPIHMKSEIIHYTHHNHFDLFVLLEQLFASPSVRFEEVDCTSRCLLSHTIKKCGPHPYNKGMASTSFPANSVTCT